MALTIMLKKDKEKIVLKFDGEVIGQIELQKVQAQNAILEIDIIKSIVIHREKINKEDE
jgi:hypothetical protein